jgi:hypothetical protein
MIPFVEMTASQSSTFYGGMASRALTASASNTWPGTCTHTASESQAWWKVVLSGAWHVSYVVLTNRAGCCPDRLQNIDVYVGSVRCATGVTIAAGATQTVPCVGTGSEIKVQHQGTNSLTLCGFQAGGTQAAMPTYLRPAYLPGSNCRCYFGDGGGLWGLRVRNDARRGGGR